MSLRRYQFCYSLSDRFTEVPTWITVTARSYRSAARKAQVRLKAIVHEERAARWEWVGHSLEGPWEPRYVPYHHVRGTLYRGEQVKPRRKRVPDPEGDARMRAMLDREASAEAGYDTTFADFVTQPILNVIENAPSLHELFAVPLPEGLPSIPLTFVTPMAREDWPDRHP